ncbi:MAG: M24 family metallopeptidase [Chloroflexi bacterium]|nr:M24 family metallopeptidase [Chloroflexota bacterium]
MGWKVDSTQAIDEGLKQRMLERVEGGTFKLDDLQDFLTLFIQVANNIDETRDEVQGFNRKFQFRLSGCPDIWLNIQGGSFEMGGGDIQAPDITLDMSAELAVGVFTGQVDATMAYMNGDLKVDGNLPDAIKFRTLVDMVREELDLEPGPVPAAGGRTLQESAKKDTSQRKAGKESKTKYVKFGVIGVGSVWDFHSAACADSPYLKFVAVYDKNLKRAEKVARRYRANKLQAYSDLDQFLQSDIDAVLIMVPHAYHADLVSRVAAAGKHILCEKPMATTLEDCDLMIKTAKEAGVKFMIAENHRFLPAHQYIHDAIKQGLIGDVHLVRAYEGVSEIEGMSQPDFWKGDPIKAGGGAFMDMGAHKFAALQWILEDEVESIYVTLSKQAINLPEKAEDNAMAMVRFIKGVVGEIVVSFTQVTPAFNSLEVYGSRGTILENHMWEKPVRIYSNHDAMGENKNQWYEPEIEHAPFPSYYNISMRCEDEYFAQCILENREPEFTPEQAKSAIAAVLMGYVSAQTGKAVTRGDLTAIEQTAGTESILHKLAEHIPINKKLPEVKRVKAVGFNRKRMEETLGKHNLDLMIVTTPVNVFYTSGMPILHASPNPILFALSNQYPNVVMVSRDGEAALFNWDLFQSVDRFSWIADHKGTIGQKETVRAIMAKIKKWGMEGKRIGVESFAPKYLLDYLAQKCPASEVVTADEVLLEMRLIKSDEEIQRIEKATQITEKAIKACIKATKEGMTDNDFLLLARKTIIDEGAEVWDHLTLSIGESDPEAPGIGTVLNKGDICRFDFGAVYKGYVADVNRHVVIGPVAKEAKEIIDRLIVLQEFYEKNVKPGVNIRQLNKEADAFYKTLKAGGLTMAIGHSIGLECEEQHLFGPLQVLDRPFEKNMVFEIEAWESFGKVLIGVEDCYVVTESGLRKITTLDKHIISL